MIFLGGRQIRMVADHQAVVVNQIGVGQRAGETVHHMPHYRLSRQIASHDGPRLDPP
jgi:hypothetical protein